MLDLMYEAPDGGDIIHVKITRRWYAAKASRLCGASRTRKRRELRRAMIDFRFFRPHQQETDYISHHHCIRTICSHQFLDG